MSRKSLALLVLIYAATSGCSKNLSTIVIHPAVEQRAADSLSATITRPSAVTLTNTGTFKFAIFGDPQIREENKTRLARFKEEVASRGIKFFAVLGDLTEDATVTEFRLIKEGLDSVGIPYYTTIGNHDLFQPDSAGGWASWKSTFGSSTYSVTIANAVRLIMIDTASGDIGATQLDWLENELKTKVDFTFVGSHYPIYDGLIPIRWLLPSNLERYKLISILSQAGVYGYMAGHIHGFKASAVNGISNFIVGSMYPYDLDYGIAGFVVFTYDQGKMSWEWVAY